MNPTKKSEDYKVKLRLAETLISLDLMSADDPGFHILGLIEMMDDLKNSMAKHSAELETSWRDSLLRRKNN